MYPHEEIKYLLGHVVGQGQVKPVDPKVQVISDFPRPEFKKQLMRYFAWMVITGNFDETSARLFSL